VHQPAPANKDGLDPLKAVPRLEQIYDPATAMVFIIDFRTVPVSVLKALEHRQLIIHNSTFEHSMLLPQGIRLRRTWDTLQLKIKGAGTGACQPRQRGAGLTTVGSYLRNADLFRGGTNYASPFKGSRA
jgi:hypothetical protein